MGQTSLGNYIFTGLQTENWIFVLFGCVSAALLALVLDQLLSLAATGLALRSRPRLVLAGLGLAAVIGLSLVPLAAGVLLVTGALVARCPTGVAADWATATPVWLQLAIVALLAFAVPALAAG